MNGPFHEYLTVWGKLPRGDAKENHQVPSERIEGETETRDQGVLVKSNEPWLMKVAVPRRHC